MSWSTVKGTTGHVGIVRSALQRQHQSRPRTHSSSRSASRRDSSARCCNLSLRNAGSSTLQRSVRRAWSCRPAHLEAECAVAASAHQSRTRSHRRGVERCGCPHRIPGATPRQEAPAQTRRHAGIAHRQEAPAGLQRGVGGEAAWARSRNFKRQWTPQRGQDRQTVHTLYFDMASSATVSSDIRQLIPHDMSCHRLSPVNEVTAIRRHARSWHNIRLRPLRMMHSGVYASSFVTQKSIRHVCVLFILVERSVFMRCRIGKATVDPLTATDIAEVRGRAATNRRRTNRHRRHPLRHGRRDRRAGGEARQSPPAQAGHDAGTADGQDSAGMNGLERPTCWIIAGPNGAGKTTFALKYLPEAGCQSWRRS